MRFERRLDGAAGSALRIVPAWAAVAVFGVSGLVHATAAAQEAAPVVAQAAKTVSPEALGLVSFHAVAEGTALPPSWVRHGLSGTTRRLSGVVLTGALPVQAPADLKLVLLTPTQGARLVPAGAGWDLEFSPTMMQPGARWTFRIAARSAIRGQQAVLHGRIEVLARQEARLQVPATGGRFPLADRIIRFDTWPSAHATGSRDVTVHYALVPGTTSMISRVLPTGMVDASANSSAAVGRYRIESAVPAAAVASPEAASLEDELDTTTPYAGNASVLGTVWANYTAPYIAAGERRLPAADVDSVESPSGQLTSLVSTGWPAAQWANVTPVLFIHGYQNHAGADAPYFSGGRTYWGNLPNLVRQYTGNAERRFAPFEYRWNTDAQFTVQGAELAAALNTIHAQTGRKVIVVAHAFGGLLARTVLQNLAGVEGSLARDRIESVLTLGAPHSGIAAAAATLHGVALPAGRQPAVGNPFATCTQVSCLVAGMPVPALSSGDLARLGLTPEPGVDVAALATTAERLPAVKLVQGVGIDQDVPSGQTGAIYRRGDGLITIEGQRLFPGEVGNALRGWSAVNGSSALVKETVLGHVDGPYVIRAQDVVDPSRWVAADRWASPGYFHGAFNGWSDIEGNGGRETQVPPKASLGCNLPDTCQHASWRLLAELLGRIGRLNDTGQVVCVDPLSSALDPIPCAGSSQDGEIGRDVRNFDSSDGSAGFSFVKISTAGAELPATATSWDCVKDRLTGLMWEVKTDDGGFRDKDNFFTNWGNGRPGDSSAYVRDVNAAGLCGASDWRLPTRDELQSLVDYSRVAPGPALDSAWFPNTIGMRHWTSTPYAGVDTYSWRVYYAHGGLSFGSREVPLSVRLVRVAR